MFEITIAQQLYNGYCWYYFDEFCPNEQIPFIAIWKHLIHNNLIYRTMIQNSFWLGKVKGITPGNFFLHTIKHYDMKIGHIEYIEYRHCK